MTWERGEDGKVLPQYKAKESQTCWECHHGEEFSGPLQPFGRLVEYYDRKTHPMMPNTSIGFFIGWKLESGCRYRGTLLIHDYEKARIGELAIGNCVSVPEREVRFPVALMCFPCAEANRLALRTLSPPPGLESLPDQYLVSALTFQFEL